MEVSLCGCFIFVITWTCLGIHMVRSASSKEDSLCRWKPVQKNTKFRKGLGAGTFHHLGYTPNMETCVDLCCSMPVCGVAFKTKDRCYGVECISDDSCETVLAGKEDVKVEISHVRAGKRPANATDMNMAGQCRPSPIYPEVTLKGGINAGTYKDVGGVSTMKECQKKCCEFPACDLAFMLAGSCYLVGCADHKSCEVQSAKKSSFHPSVSYVTRWNSEGVKHTVMLQEKASEKYTCPKMNPLTKVTLKGGLQAGDFTDVGKVKDLPQCYDICCQQPTCDLAFMLGQNCFSVQCKDKKQCGTVPAQPSIFNPQIAYIATRNKLSAGATGAGSSAASDSPIPSTDITKLGSVKGMSTSPLECPNTKIMDKVTLKGGVDAGTFHDNGKVLDMKQCRRICCEMPTCHLAFLLGKNCFSVKCSNVDACRAQPAKPSAFAPQISYVRKVGTNELLKSEEATAKPAALSTKAKPNADAKSPNPLQQALGSLGDSRPNEMKPKDYTKPKENFASKLLQLNGDDTAKPSDASALTTSDTKESSQKTESDSHNSVEPDADTEKTVKTDSDTQKTVTGDSNCAKVPTLYNVTLKGGKHAGEFKEVSDAKSMKDCILHCCEDKTKKCNLAFMLGTSCYSITCKTKELCDTIPAPPSGFNPQLAIVRSPGGEKKKNTAAPDALLNMPEAKESDSEKPKAKPDETGKEIKSDKASQENKKKCLHQSPIKNKSLKGGKKAGKFRYFKDIKDMTHCTEMCCSRKDCDVAYMEGGKCYTISCFKKDLCMAVDHRPSDVSPLISYMDHFLNQPEEIETDKEIGTELSSLNIEPEKNDPTGACSNVEVEHNVTLKGGTRAGIFKDVGKIGSMKKCVSSCCDRPDCDIAYFLNGHCFSVQCLDTNLCQSSPEPAGPGDTVSLAYMNKAGIGEYKRDFLVVYIIGGSLAFVATAGAIIWAVFAFTKRQRLKHKKRLLDAEEEPVEEFSRPAHPRYRTPASRY